MRMATIAKLSLTAVVGLGSLIGPATSASAGGAPQGGGKVAVNPGHGDPEPGDIKDAPPTTSTTMKPIVAQPWDPEPDPPYDPDLPIADPQDDDDCPAHQPSCDIVQPQDDEDCPAHQPNCDIVHPQGDDEPEPEPGCSEVQANCDEIAQPDPGCNLTHGCPDGDDPCRPDEHTGADCDGGGTGGTDGDPGDGTTGGTTGGTDGHGGRLPKTGGDILALAAMGIGLTGAGAAAKRFARRS